MSLDSTISDPASPVVDIQRVVDVRGPRFAAAITTTVLVIALALAAVSIPAAATVLAVQALVFGVTALVGPAKGPYGRAYQVWAAPRLGPTTEREPVAPLRFAQLVGFFFAAGGVIAFGLGANIVGSILGSFALFAAFLNAAFGICLGCQVYPLVAHLRK